MRPITLPLTALALVAATDVAPPSAPSDAPAATDTEMREIRPFTPSEQQCRNLISQVRQEAGKPPLLDREPASPDKPYHIYAVDRRQDGCAVMVVKGDPADIRPIPKAADGPFVIMPLGQRR